MAVSFGSGRIAAALDVARRVKRAAGGLIKSLPAAPEGDEPQKPFRAPDSMHQMAIEPNFALRSYPPNETRDNNEIKPEKLREKRGRPSFATGGSPMPFLPGSGQTINGNFHPSYTYTPGRSDTGMPNWSFNKTPIGNVLINSTGSGLGDPYLRGSNTVGPGGAVIGASQAQVFHANANRYADGLQKSGAPANIVNGIRSMPWDGSLGRPQDFANAFNTLNAGQRLPERREFVAPPPFNGVNTHIDMPTIGLNGQRDPARPPEVGVWEQARRNTFVNPPPGGWDAFMQRGQQPQPQQQQQQQAQPQQAQLQPPMPQPAPQQQATSLPMPQQQPYDGRGPNQSWNQIGEWQQWLQQQQQPQPQQQPRAFGAPSGGGNSPPMIASPPTQPVMQSGQNSAPRIFSMAKGGKIDAAVALARKYANGGLLPTTPWQTRQQSRRMGTPGQMGPLISPVGGRTDHIQTNVPAGGYVIPADIPSALGQGNTLNGMKVLDGMFNTGPYGMKNPAQNRAIHAKLPRPPKAAYADGGPTFDPGLKHRLNQPTATEQQARINLGGLPQVQSPPLVPAPEPPVPILAAGGEYILSPEQVMEAGGGNLDHGHAALDAWVLDTRKEYTKTLKSLPPPAR